MGKYKMALWALAMTAAVPGFAQDVPAAAEKKAPATSATPKPGGAVSSSYARCVPGEPNTKPDEACPSTEPAEGKGRTYTGGRRNEEAPVVSAEPSQGSIATVNSGMPNRLSMTPTTAKKVVPATPPAQPAKGHSEKGIK